MEVIYERCCGIDVHKKIIVACLRIGSSKELRQYSSTTRDLREMTEWLKQQDCQMIAMESTGSYWKPLYNIFELSELDVIVVNAQHMRNLPGRKTDVKDAEWIADLLRHGLLKASYIPDREQRELREITRYRKSLVGERSREINRLQKFLEGSNIKISSVVSDTNGVSSLNLIRTFIKKGQLSKEEIKELIDPKMYKKIDDISLAMEGVFSKLQKELVKAILDHIEDMNKRIDDLDKIMKDYLSKYEKAIEDIDEIPGIGTTSAKIILAEIGLDMNRFPTSGHLCSWAGLSPGNNESAGKRKTGKTTKGNPTLKSILIQCGTRASNLKGTFYHAQYQRIAKRRGKNKAHVAVAHSMLISIYNMLKNGESYKELGDGYYNQFNKEKKINQLLKHLKDLGWQASTA